MTPKEIEAELRTRQALVDCNSGNIVSQNGKKLLGECNKCGKCCRFEDEPTVPYPDFIKRCCSHLVPKIIGGQQRYVCDIYSIRPVSCGFWPEITDFENNQVPEECDLYYEE